MVRWKSVTARAGPVSPGEGCPLEHARSQTRVVRQLQHGQITIPKEFREALGLEQDDLLQVTLGEGKLEAAPAKAAPRHPAWAKRLYDLFAPVRESLEGSSEAEINAAIDEPETFRFSMEGDGEDALKRIVGCLLVINMPRTGLDEALTSLRDIWEFWHARSVVSLPERTGLETTASVISAQVRPELVLPD